MPAYELDTTGINSNNLIENESHSLTESNSSPYRLIIPTYSPFYLDNFNLRYDNGLGNIISLVEDVDYSLCLPYVAATRSIGKLLYGGISINNNSINGTLLIDYQTLGGNWTGDPAYIITRLSELLYNPKITIWDVVTDIQDLFPPINHDQSADYIYGYQDLITAINNLADIIANSPSQSLSFVQHLTDEVNPHNVTKVQLGLGSIVNLPLASDAEVTARDPLDKYVTLKQLVNILNV